MSLNDWIASYQDFSDEAIEIRREMHRHPELSFQEVNTRARIAEWLKSFGYTAINTDFPGGVVLTLSGKEAGPVIALRADFDALAITEETGLPFASENPGVMHACGHDAHTAALLAVAKTLQPFESQLKGTLKLVFQHAEEIAPGGAIDILRSGVLDDVDFIYGIHVRGDYQYDGQIQVCSGYAMAASDAFEITIQGKGGHGAAPHDTVDPTVVAAFVVNQLQTLISRNKNPLLAGVLTTAVFQTKSHTANIIADSSFLKGTVRTFDPELRDLIEQRMRTMVEGICAGFGATCSIKYTRGYPALYNHPEQTEIVKQLFAGYVSETKPRMGGEDFAYYLEKIPGSFFFVPAGPFEKNYPHHHPKFQLDERCIDVSVKAFLKVVDYYLGNKEGGE